MSSTLHMRNKGASRSPLGPKSVVFIPHPKASPPLPALLLAATLLLAGALVSGCGATDSHVKAAAASLGRVVVYRNGIAFYERRAHVKGDKLVLTVPNDKVDDFLKSLTVRDAKTGKALPVSFPTRRASRGSVVDMAITLPPPGPHDLVLSYITEAPAWKPSYRVSLGEGDTVALQGWAIVDNTSGEDWRAVRVGVGSSSALAFRYDLRSVRRVHRETLRTRATFAKAPPQGGSVYGGGKKKEATLMVLADGDIPKPIGHPDRPQEVAEAERDERADEADGPAQVATVSKEKSGILDYFRSGGGGGGGGRRSTASAPRRRSYGKSAPRKAPKPQRISPAEQQRRQQAYAARRKQQQAMAKQRSAEAKVRALASKLNKGQDSYVIEGYANPGEPDAMANAMARANTLRNQLIANGVAPGRLQVAGKGVVPGRRAGVGLVRTQQPTAKGGKSAGDDGQPVGESHFDSEIPMTVRQRTSAMVPILQQGAKGEVVYLFDAEGSRGDGRYAFKSIRFRNPTDSTLESGPMTVYGSDRFIGEGLTGAIPPRSVAVVPFALDRQVVVEQQQDTGDEIARLLRVHRGVFTAEVSHVRTSKLKVTNRLPNSARVFVRHTVRKGWKLSKHPKVHERLGRSHLFEVQLGAGETSTVEIVETTPMTRTLDLRSATGLDLVRVWLAGAKQDSAVMKQMRALLVLNGEMAGHRQTIASLRERTRQFRERMDELHLQILSLKSVKVGGTLLKHLNKKMTEISNRVQANTLATVNAQEKLMMTRIRFQDAAAELSLEPKGLPQAPSVR